MPRLLVTAEVDAATAAALRKILEGSFAGVIKQLPPEDPAKLEELLCTATTDTASVALAVLAKYPWLSAKCFPHVIQLIYTANLLPLLKGANIVVWDKYVATGSSLPDDFPGCSELRIIVADVKAIIVQFAHSSKVMRAYCKAWKELHTTEHSRPLKPVFDVVTRWSSTFNSLVRFACMWPVLKDMPLDKLGFPAASNSAAIALKTRLTLHVSMFPALLPLLELFFIWTERFQASEPTMFLVRPAAIVSYVRHTPCVYVTARVGEPGFTTRPPPPLPLVSQELEHVTRPVASDEPKLAAIRAALHSAVLERFADVLGDTNRTALLATFFHPYYCSLLLQRGADGKLLPRSMELLLGWKEESGDVTLEHKGIIGALEDDFPNHAKVPDLDGIGGAPTSRVASDVSAYLTDIRLGVLGVMSADTDVVKLWATDPRFTKFGVIKYAAASYLSARPANSDTEKDFSLMGGLLTPKRSCMNHENLAGLSLLTSDSRLNGPPTRKTTPYSQVDVALLMLKGKSRKAAINEVKKAKGIVGADDDDNVDDGEIIEKILTIVGPTAVGADGSIDLDVIAGMSESAVASLFDAREEVRAAASSASPPARPAAPSAAAAAGSNSTAAAAAAATTLKSVDLGPRTVGSAVLALKKKKKVRVHKSVKAAKGNGEGQRKGKGKSNGKRKGKGKPT